MVTYGNLVISELCIFCKIFPKVTGSVHDHQESLHQLLLLLLFFIVIIVIIIYYMEPFI